MKFTKMHGAGNDYVYVNCFKETVSDPVQTSIKVSDRHFGIGSDGLILILPSEVADFKMEIYNADGSMAEMCGNGIRCVAKYVYDYGLTDQTTITVETGAGILTIEMYLADGKVSRVKVDMGEPILDSASIPVVSDKNPVVADELTVDGTTYQMTCVSMGNPHCIIFTNEDILTMAKIYGPEIEKHPYFPEKTNVEFVKVVSRNEVDMRVYERGCGITLACGTGACATVAACVLNNLTEGNVRVNLLGGAVNVEWQASGQDVNKDIYLIGPAEYSFEAEYIL